MSTIDFDDVRLVSAGGIRHKVAGGLTFDGDDEKVGANLDVIIQAADFGDFLDEMFPQPLIIGGPGGLISISPRMYLLNAPWLRMKSFSTDIVEKGKPLDPFNADPNAPDGTYGTLMMVKMRFETMQETDEEEPDEGDPTTFLEHSINAGAEYLHIPPKKIDVSEQDVEQWVIEGEGAQPQAPPDAEANKDAELGIYKVIPTIEHSLKWKFALNPSWTNIYRRLGTVNQAVIRLFNNAKRETVLFTGISGSRSYRYFRRRTDTTPWELDFKFSQRAIYEGSSIYGWNHVYSPSKQKWVRPVRVNDNNKPLYEASDFTKLFVAES